MDIEKYWTTYAFPKLVHWDELPLHQRRSLMYSTVGAAHSPDLKIPLVMFNYQWEHLVGEAKPMDRPLKPQDNGQPQTKVFGNRPRCQFRKPRKPEYID